MITFNVYNIRELATNETCKITTHRKERNPVVFTLRIYTIGLHKLFSQDNETDNKRGTRSDVK